MGSPLSDGENIGGFYARLTGMDSFKWDNSFWRNVIFTILPDITVWRESIPVATDAGEIYG